MRTRLLAFGAVSLLLTSIGTASAAAPDGVYTATVETPANFDDEAGGYANADDPAIYVADRPARSVVLGTLKNGGLDAFDLAGRRIQHVDVPPAPGDDLEEGRFNNVDILTGTGFGDLAVVTDRGRDRLRSYRIDPRGAAAGDRVLTELTSPRATRLFSATEPEVEEQRTGYGLALREHHRTPLSAGAAPRPSACSGCARRRAGSATGVPTPWCCTRRSGSPTVRRGRRAASPARARRWRAWWSTRSTTCCTPRRRTSASGGSRCSARRSGGRC
ncbi:phytase [Nocardioides speluncae]|uniref:phytase n=1 Tax=Nocardioides speluncae TaxID=2670337 RepID=UPI0019809702|nr:phytase [Nocardioides speluncae]